MSTPDKNVHKNIAALWSAYEAQYRCMEREEKHDA